MTSGMKAEGEIKEAPRLLKLLILPGKAPL
jgi:hypothetical protein